MVLHLPGSMSIMAVITLSKESISLFSFLHGKRTEECCKPTPNLQVSLHLHPLSIHTMIGGQSFCPRTQIKLFILNETFGAIGFLNFCVIRDFFLFYFFLHCC